MNDTDRKHRNESVGELLVMLNVPGMALALHFALWNASLGLTSLSHSFVLVSCYPLIMVAWMIMEQKWNERKPINERKIVACVSRREVLFTIIGFVGIVIMMVDVNSDNSISFIGDFCAFAGAVALVVYMIAGQKLRKWMPAFVYSFPVTAIAAFWLLIGAACFEDILWTGMDPNAVMGLFNSEGPYYAFYFILAVVVGPGIFGHTFVNIVLGRLSPLVVSVAMQTEPLFGTIFGMLVGMSDPPKIYTIVGGIVNLIATLLTVHATATREEQEKKGANVNDTIILSSLESANQIRKLNQEIRMEQLQMNENGNLIVLD